MARVVQKGLSEIEEHFCVTKIWYMIKHLRLSYLASSLLRSYCCMCVFLLPPAQTYTGWKVLSVASLRCLCLSRKRYCNSRSVTCVHEHKDWPHGFVMTQFDFGVRVHKYSMHDDNDYECILSHITSRFAGQYICFLNCAYSSDRVD